MPLVHILTISSPHVENIVLKFLNFSDKGDGLADEAWDLVLADEWMRLAMDLLDILLLPNSCH